MGRMSPGNPFTPSFGVSPPLLVGRESQLADVEAALDATVGDPFRAVKVVGLRGAGKTVFLNHVEDVARVRGWVIISETAHPRLVDRLVRTVLPTLLTQEDPDARRSTVTGGSAGVLGTAAGIQRDVAHRYVPEDDLRALLTRLIQLAENRGTGVLVTVDEMNPRATDDLQAITQVVQHCFREGRNLAFAGAGLPLEVASLLDEPGTTFLRRAEEITVGVIPADEVRRGLLEPLTTWGRQIAPQALDAAVAGVKGYPFLLQAIGHRLWATSTDGIPITEPDAQAAITYANRRIGDLVMAPELKGLSPIDRSYLTAMAIDPGPSRTREVAERLGVSPQYANSYRSRLIQAGLITEAGYGAVDFVLPTLRDYLREHTVLEPLSVGEAPTVTPPGLSGTAQRQRSRRPQPGPR